MNISSLKTISVEVKNSGICYLTLNRPEVLNAFDEQMIQEITETLQTLKSSDSVRILVLTGAGKSFCAGADLNWMRRMSTFDQKTNVNDAKKLATMMWELNHFPRPSVGFVHGNVFGGGVGLVACCDVVVAVDSTTFSLSEIKLGLIPAVISPYVINSIGARNARRYFITGERFDAETARDIQLIHESCSPTDLSSMKQKILNELLSSAPEAQRIAKSFILNELTHSVDSTLKDKTAELIAAIRASDEGRNGVLAFLNRSKPPWRLD